jgi:hypothetical protein
MIENCIAVISVDMDGEQGFHIHGNSQEFQIFKNGY